MKVGPKFEPSRQNGQATWSKWYWPVRIGVGSKRLGWSLSPKIGDKWEGSFQPFRHMAFRKTVTSGWLRWPQLAIRRCDYGFPAFRQWVVDSAEARVRRYLPGRCPASSALHDRVCGRPAGGVRHPAEAWANHAGHRFPMLPSSFSHVCSHTTMRLTRVAKHAWECGTFKSRTTCPPKVCCFGR